MELTNVIKRIIERFGKVATIWQFKRDKNDFVIFIHYGDEKGIYYNIDSDICEQNYVDCVALEETCNLIYE